MLAAALAWHAAGASVVRVALDGTKRPLGDWKGAQSVRADEQQIRDWFANGHAGLGVVMGAVSGGLEMFEFEGRAVAEGLADQFNEIVEASGLAEVWNRVKCGYTDRSPSGGFHVVWRVQNGQVPGNTKLAARPARPEELTEKERQILAGRPEKVFQRDLIETRGEGGQSVMAPSHGPVHDTGQPYVLLAGSPATVAAIDAGHRDALLEIARMLDQMPTAPEPAPLPAQRPSGPRTADNGVSPGDDFEARTPWTDILTPHGWTALFTRGHTTYWRRPGKNLGVSATTGHDPARDRLYVFTSSTEFDPERPFTKFGAYALLEHRGDHSAAAKVLRGRGFGSRPQHLRPVQAGPRTVGATALATAPDAWSAPVEQQPLLQVPMPRREWDDIGNAVRVFDRYGEEIRWIADTEQWAVYSGGRWTLRGALTGVWTRVVSTVDHMVEEADQYSDEPPDLTGIERPTRADKRSERENFLVFARQQRMRPKLAAAREVLQALPAVHTEMAAFDQHPLLLNVGNGIVDLASGQLQAHDRSLYLMQQSPVRYDPAATAPMWARFLESAMPDEERRAYLARVVGYTITGSTSEQVMFIHHGDGENGKGVFIRVLAALLGDYAQSVPRSTLLAKQGEGIPNDIARMMGKRLLSTSETSAGKRLDDELVKTLTGQDVQTARYMRAEYFEFEPVGKIHLATNYLPHVGGGHGIARRLQDIGWDVVVPKDRRIPDLDKKIIASEIAGVLNWAIRGCLEWQKRGLDVPESVKAKTREHLASSNPLVAWLDEETTEVPDVVTETRLLYANYKGWSETSGLRPMSLMSFSLALQERGLSSGKDPKTRRAVTTGLRLNAVNPGRRG
ncbi:hypothetical protein CG736_19250 [Kitasatospora sp. CB02891]|nr:hypothetical protein CG736_19250 [Kitasatospora sp. CB02891]